MSFSPSKTPPLAAGVEVTDRDLKVELKDGRTVTAPLDWFPRLAHGSMEERNHWELIGSGLGIHWPDLDEDISVQALIFGERSAESRSSLDRWLAGRKK